MSNKDKVLGVLAASNSASTSLKRLEKSLPGMMPTEITAAMDALEEYGIVASMGTLGIHWSVDLDALNAAVHPEPKEQAPEPEPEKNPDDDKPEGKPEGKPDGKPKLKNELPTKPKKMSKLDALLAQINATEAPRVFEGDERKAKEDSTLEEMMEIVVRVNAGITALSERVGFGIIDPDTDLVAIVRDESGVKATYSPDGGRSDRVLFFEAWPKAMTERWCAQAIKRLERQATDLLGRMTKYCVSRNGKRK